MAGYRPAVDGLRALAVGSVIAYHLGLSWLPGGFLGVDLFFVLSGYLITGILIAEYQKDGRINLQAFFARRARRLLPALLLVITVVAAAARYLVPVSDWGSLRADMLATLMYVANWRVIAVDRSYFAPLEPSPLEHTWSLSIEEQFYLLWPLLVLCAMWAMRRVRAKRALGVAGLAAAIGLSAVALAAAYDPASPTRAYVGSDGRVQQLLVGAVLALVLAKSAVSSRPALWIGMAALASGLLSFAFVNDSGAFYYFGGATAVAVVFAAAIWWVEMRPDSVAGRVLSSWPLRATGRISYGLYLWHWPVIVFLPMLVPAMPEAFLPLAVIGLTLVLAMLSYHLVERPIRLGLPRFAVLTPRRVAWSAISTATVCAVLVGAATTPTTAAQKQVHLAAEAEDPCPGTEQACVREQAGKWRPVLLVVGDSIAKSLDAGFADLARRRKWTYVTAARNGCGLTGMLHTETIEPKPWLKACADETPARLREVVERYRPTMVVAVSRWELISYLGTDNTIVAPQTERWAADTKDGLVSFAKDVTRTGAHLAMVEVLPGPPKPTPDCLTVPEPADCFRAPDALTEAANELYRKVAKKVAGTSAVSMRDVVCPGERCSMLVDGIVLRHDGMHFTPEGARFFVKKLEPRVIDVFQP